MRTARLGLWMTTALVVGNIIGSGIFLLPASLAPLGADQFSGWLVTGGGAVILALVFATLARERPRAGGPYAYTREAFGELAAFLVAWGYWVAVWVGNAAIALGSVGYLGDLFPALTASPLRTALTTLFFVWALTAVNAIGIRAAGWVQAVTTVLKLLPLAAVLVLLALHAPQWTARAAGPATFTLQGTAAAATLTLWAMLGLESATIPADKVDRPERTIPLATVGGTLATAILCAAACGGVVLMLPAKGLAGSSAPFSDLMRQVWGMGAGRALSVFAAISGFGALNGWILLQGEMPAAMARDGLFPRAFAAQSGRGTPTRALVLSSGLITVLVLLNLHGSLVKVFTFFILLGTAANLIAYLASALARIKLNGAGSGRPGWRPLLGLLGTLYALAALAGAGREAMGWGLALMVAGLPLYFLRRKSTS